MCLLLLILIFPKQQLSVADVRRAMFTFSWLGNWKGILIVGGIKKLYDVRV